MLTFSFALSTYYIALNLLDRSKLHLTSVSIVGQNVIKWCSYDKLLSLLTLKALQNMLWIPSHLEIIHKKLFFTNNQIFVTLSDSRVKSFSVLTALDTLFEEEHFVDLVRNTGLVEELSHEGG